MILSVLIAIVAGEIITKWGLRGFLLLMHTCLHPLAFSENRRIVRTVPRPLLAI